MPTDLKFQQFLNTIVIGVLFELVLVVFVNQFPELIEQLPFGQFQFLHKDNATLTVVLGVIFSFPSWRFISSFVGYIMEPVVDQSSNTYSWIRKYYILFFLV